MTNIAKEFLKNKKKFRKLLRISIKQRRERSPRVIQKRLFYFEFNDVYPIFLTN